MAPLMMLDGKPLSSMSKHVPPTQVTVAYAVFLLIAMIIYHMVAEGEFSAILTMSVMLQCLAIGLLVMQMMSSGSAAGISVKALILDALAFACRLSSTTWLNGYLPADITGDYIFQFFDIASLVLTLWLVHRVLTVNVETYNESDDSLPIAPLFLGALVLAVIFHGDLDARPLFDILWMTGLFTGTVAVLPQLWLITRKGGCVEALTSHSVAVMAVSRMLSGIFMWYARHDITCSPWIEGFNHAPWAILGSHALHLLLLGDFAYYYAKAVATQGLACCIDPVSDWV